MNNTMQWDEEWTCERIFQANRQLRKAHPDQILTWGLAHFNTKIVLGTGFGPSGMLLIHRIYSLGLDISIFYLDTHLLFERTYNLRDQLEEKYDVSITPVQTGLSLTAQAEQYGDELWNRDPDRCCYLRKVLPLKKYLANKEAWITGVRREQSESRRNTQIVEWDPENEIVKINPLAGWTSDKVWDYIHHNSLPYNPMHDEGYPSIGCIPCTQPVDEQAEDQRAGRWGGFGKIECGIHLPAQKNAE